jgi:hypothetical protein
METMHYIGLDVHKRTISYCVKDSSDKVHSQGKIPATIWIAGLRCCRSCGVRRWKRPCSAAGSMIT